MADNEPFLVSTIAGLPADASLSASSDMKARLGPLAFVVTGVQEALEFDGLHFELSARTDDGETSWSGDALCLLVGNARRFVADGGQGDMEDGLFDVAIVERMPAPNLVAEAIGHRLLGTETPGVTHLRSSELPVVADEPVRFSRDGELAELDGLDVHVRERVLDLRVGPGYDPTRTECWSRAGTRSCPAEEGVSGAVPVRTARVTSQPHLRVLLLRFAVPRR